MVELIVHDLLLIQASPNSCKVDVYERTRGEGREFTSVSKGTWEELTNLCPEEIERDSVSCLEIRYNGTTPRNWSYSYSQLMDKREMEYLGAFPLWKDGRQS